MISHLPLTLVDWNGLAIVLILEDTFDLEDDDQRRAIDRSKMVDEMKFELSWTGDFFFFSTCDEVPGYDLLFDDLFGEERRRKIQKNEAWTPRVRSFVYRCDVMCRVR